MDYLKCKTDFQEFINSDYGAVEQCIKIFKEKLVAEEDIYEDLLNGKCIEITKKKTSYYDKIYDPTPIIINFKHFLGEENPIYLNFVEYCNPTINENCCNCISVSLYILDVNNYCYLSRFIFTIQQSISNVQKYLPDWIYRLYLDPSVFEAIRAVGIKAETDESSKYSYSELYKLYVDTIKQIANQPNCEIYLTMCTDYSEGRANAGKRRISRFRGFVDEDVNINACREADGIVDAIDCYNLKIFEKLPIATFAYHLGSMPGEYYYSTVKNYGPITDLVFSFSAGLIASKFKIKKTIFEQHKKTVLDAVLTQREKNFKTFDEWFLMEMFRVFTQNKKFAYEIKYLFGILPNTKTVDSDIYSVFISGDDLDKLTDGVYSSINIDEFNEDELKIKSGDLREYMQVFYSTKTDTDPDYYPVGFFLSNLCIYHVIYNTKLFKYIRELKITQPNKFINLVCMYGIINMTTEDALLITEKDGEIDFTLVDLFSEILAAARIEIPMIGGYQNKVNNDYLKKYLKYKSKYIELKNATKTTLKN